MTKKNLRTQFLRDFFITFVTIFCLEFLSCCAAKPKPEQGYGTKPGYYPRSYQQTFHRAKKPSSRGYTNPYARPSQNYHQYYDQDYYYVAPREIEGREPDEPIKQADPFAIIY